jgi:DNA-binding CsgD family transcriptional regulator
MMKDKLLSDADVRAMVRLLGSTCAVKGDISQKRRHLMTGLCRLVQADAWGWAMVAELNPKKLPVYIGFLHGGFSEDSFARYLAANAHPDMIWATASYSRELQKERRHLTRSAQQVYPLEKFARAEAGQLWRDCGFNPGIISFYPLPEGVYSGIALYRKCTGELFGARERKIAHILMAEVPWLHVNQSQETVLTNVPRLPVRQRLALELLIQGHSRKMIADDMRISINTVSGYVRDIYRFFGVRSHPQLVRRFFRGDGGDAATAKS